MSRCPVLIHRSTITKRYSSELRPAKILANNEFLSARVIRVRGHGAGGLLHSIATPEKGHTPPLPFCALWNCMLRRRGHSHEDSGCPYYCCLLPHAGLTDRTTRFGRLFRTRFATGLGERVVPWLPHGQRESGGGIHAT